MALGGLRCTAWAGRDRFEPAPDARQALPLSAGVSCHTVAASTAMPAQASAGGRESLAAVRSALSQKVIGDGLVPLESALGRHAQPQHQLAFAPEYQWIAGGMNHMDLLSRREVAQQLVRWLGAGG